MPNEKISKGILNSEAFAFCALSDFFKADLIIESGICNGGSTEIWCKYFTKRTMMNIPPVIAIDIDLLPKAINRLVSYNNIQLIKGDSTQIIPNIIKEITNANISVFIDGPKNQAGVKLAQICLEFPQVKLVAVHDMCRIFYNTQYCIGRQLIDKWSGVHKFYTDNSDFVFEYKKLDGSFADTPCDKYIYGSCTEKQGYGPTLGLVWKG